MKKLSRQQWAMVAAAALILLAAVKAAVDKPLFPSLTASQPPNAPIQVTTVPVGTINKPLYLSRTGVIQSSTSVPVNAVASGRITEIYVKEGQSIKAGQPLFKMDAVAAAPAATPQPPAVATASPSYEKAQEEYTRYQKLFAIGAISKKQLEASAARVQAAKESQIQDTQAAPTAISGPVTVSAPTSGIASGLTMTPGKEVQAGQQLLFLGSGQDVEALIPLTQNDLYLVHLGTGILIETPSQPLPGQVSAIYPKIEAGQEPSFLAHVKLTANPGGLLKAGMAVSLRIATESAAPVPAVPTSAIIKDGEGRKFLYLAENNKAVLQEITVGDTLGDVTELTSKLPDGSRIIITPLEQLKNGYDLVVNQ